MSTVAGYLAVTVEQLLVPQNKLVGMLARGECENFVNGLTLEKRVCQEVENISGRREEFDRIKSIMVDILQSLKKKKDGDDDDHVTFFNIISTKWNSPSALKSACDAWGEGGETKGDHPSITLLLDLVTYKTTCQVREKGFVYRFDCL